MGEAFYSQFSLDFPISVSFTYAERDNRGSHSDLGGVPEDPRHVVVGEPQEAVGQQEYHQLQNRENRKQEN